MQLRLSRVFDASALTVAALCAVHCLALVVAIVFAPAAILHFGGEEAHFVFLAIAIPLSILAFETARRGHGRVTPSLFGYVGLICLGLAATFHGALALETAATLLALTLLAIGHVLNWRLAAASQPAG